MTTQTLRPDAQVSALGLTRVPNVAANLNLDDTPVDAASYVVGTFQGANVYLGLGTYTLAAGERVRYATPRLQIFHDAADVGNREYVDVKLYDPTTKKSTSTFSSSTVTNTPGIMSTGAALAKAPGNVAWSQAIVDRLQFLVVWRVSAGFSLLRVAEVYVDLDVNNQPVVSAVTASGYTASTRPTGSYTWSDADNDIQTRSQWKAFSAAQYGIAGFDPETSPNTWDSGAVFGSSADTTVGTDLVNGVTYKIYAKAAQDWPGAEGPLWWSAWAASAAFTVALSPPLTPSMTAVGQTAVPAYRALLTVTAPVNLLTLDEADFEVAIGGWAADVNCAVVRSTTLPANGVADLQLTATAGATMSARTASGTSGKPVLGSTQYMAVASFRSAVTARSVNVQIRWYNRAGGLDSTSVGSNVTDGTGGYTQAVVTATSPAAAVYATVVVQVVSAAAAEVHRVDMVSLHAGPSTTWTQGDMTLTDALTVERAEKVANYRGAAQNWAHPQLASGGGLTRGVDGWYARAASLLTSVPLDGPPMTGAAGAGQARMVVWRPTTGAGNFLDFGLDTAATTDPTPPYLAPAVVGLSTRVAVWAKTRTGTFAARLFAYAVDAANTVVTTANSGITTLTTGWQRLTVDVTPAAGACYLRGAVEDNTPTVEVDVCVTGVRICPTTVDDGTTPPGQGIQGVWSPVRLFDTAAPTSPGETFTLYDHEVPPGRPVLYRARLSATVSGQAVSSAPSAPVGLLMDPPTRTCLKDPYQPENAMVLGVARGDDAARTEDAAVLHALGDDGNPVKVRSWRSGLDAGLNLTALSDLDLYRLEQLLPSSHQLLVQWAEGGQRYYLVTGYTATRVVTGLHRVTVATLETGRPA